MADIATNIFAFVLGLGFLIFAHEAGHFLVAKAFRVRVLVFSLGFGKRLFGFRKGGTDYRVSVFPLGGYVRMAGDVPRATVTGQGAMINPPSEDEAIGNPDEFLSKPKWQRFLILLAGPAMNLLIAIAVMAGIAMHGTQELIMRPIIGEIVPNKPAAKAGLQVRDQITVVNGEAINDFDDLRLAITLHANTPLRVEYVRNGVKHTTTLTPLREETDYGPVGRAGIGPFIEPIVGSVSPDTAAARAGVQPGDRIVALNGRPVIQFTDLNDALTKGVQLDLDLQRGAQPVHVTLPAAAMDPNNPYRGLLPPSVIRKLGLFAALQDSVEQNWKMLKYAGIAIGRIFRGEGSVKELSGPVSIARISGDMLRRGALNFIALVAMISLQLGVMNLLPIPVLDGGHIFILLIEGVARRDLSIVVKERIQQLGFAALAALMIVVIYNDVVTNLMRTKTG